MTERESGVRLFVYGGLAGAGAARAAGDAGGFLSDCNRIGRNEVRGTLFDIDGRYPALMLAGTDRVEGGVWECAPERIHELDGYDAVLSGRFRRVGIEIDGRGCWVYVAGPALAARLGPDRRIATGRWSFEEERV